MKKDNIEAIYPLSPMQQGMLFHNLYAPESEMYFEQVAYTLHGDLVVAAFKQAWQQIIAHHSPLRTLFMWENLDNPLQVVRQRVDLPWAEQDWRHLTDEEQDEQVQAWMRADRTQGFDLTHAPLLRLHLIRLSDYIYHFTWSFHHILLDGWSTSTVLNEVFSCYEALRQGQELSLPSRRPYRDYITWLRRQDLQKAEIYWRETLHGFTTPTPLNSDLAPRHEPEAAANYHDQRLRIPESTTKALHTFARQHQLTLNTLVQGAWAVLLSRYSGQHDVVFGTIVSGRPAALAGVDEMIGLFINTLPLRVQVEPSQRLLPWLQSLQANQAEARQYEYTPLVQIQNWSEVPRGQGLFESLLVFENYPADASREQESSLSIRNAQAIERTNYPLTVMVVPDRSLLIQVSYDGSRFTSEHITRSLGHLCTMMESMLASPQQHLSDISMLTPAERQHLLFESNATTTPYPQHASIAALFQEHVERTPDTIALVCDDSQLSYSELHLRASQLASHLQHLGVGPERLVALYLERSLDLVIATLATLQAGGAYLPLSLDDPGERLSFILAETQPAMLLTQYSLQEKLPPHTIATICLERDWPSIRQQSTDPLPDISHADSLAYVMYTSGSSGRPKGVAARQQGVVRLVRQATYARLDATQIFLQFAPTSFDAATLEIWGALLNGARLVLAPPGLLAMSDLSRMLHEHHITLLWLSAGVFQQAAEFIPQTLAQVRLVLAGGDVLSASHVQRLLQLGTGQTILNGYGPTENTTFTCTYAMQTVEQAQGPLPIGRPISNTTCYLLDANLHPVPVGVVGDLYTGGDGLARGYFSDPALTAERFVPHPFSQQPGERLYKTGDLARYRADGVIEFLGRRDQQVKLRGFRIELSEIEAALSQHPSVREAVVVMREDHPGSKRLVAYLVLQPHATFTISEVRHYLHTRLPDYMVPAAFIPLEELPLTPNGKLDRRALPAPEKSRPDLDQAYTAPHTAPEHLLAVIWAQVLGLTQVGIHDNFFELGGDSILSIRIVAKAMVAGLHLTPRYLFQYQTIAQLAAAISTESANLTDHNQDYALGPLSPTPIQHWFFGLPLSQQQHWNQAILLETPQSLDFAYLQEAARFLLAHHDMLRLQAQQQGGYWSLAIAPLDDEQIPFSLIDLSTLSTEEQQAALELAANRLQASLDLSQGPIVRVAFFKLGEQRSGRLLFIIHHLAVDIISWSILLEDFESVYQQLCRGQEPILPPKTTSYQSWSEHLSEYAQTPQLRSQLGFWLNQPWTHAHPLPVDMVNDAETNTEESARSMIVALSPEETQALLTEVPKAYHTHITEVLLTALVQAFARWTGHTTLLVHLEGHGREDVLDGIDLSRTVGWFTSLAPLVLSLPNSMQPGEALKSIKEQLRQMPQHGLSFGLLRYLCQDSTISTQLATLPHPEISFNYFGRSDSPSVGQSLFTSTTESVGDTSSPRNQRSHMLEINENVTAGQLYIEWTYSANLHHSKTIEKLAFLYLDSLQELITHCQSPEAGGYTPSDFPEANLTQKMLDTLVTTLSHTPGTNEVEQKKLDIEAIYPLSPMQQGMLFHYLYDPQSEVYFEQIAFTLHSNLDVTALKLAWEQVIARHGILRTLFLWEQLDAPLQIVRQRVDLPWTEHDWRHLSTNEHAHRLQDFLRAECVQGFDLSQAPLLRLHLIRLSEQEWYFTWSFHHILLDGWSVSRILGEVFTCYRTLCQGYTPSLPTGRPYRDYIRWLLQQDLSQAETFWREALRGFTTPTPLGVDHSASNEPETSMEYHERLFRLSAATTATLHTFARQHQLTLNTLLQGAWALLLSRYSGQHDVVFGTIVSGRPATLPGVDEMVGLFINTFPLRVQVTPQQRLLPWLHTLQASQAEARQYEYTPLVQIQNWSEVPRGQALFESLLVFENYPVDTSLEEENSSGIVNAQARERTNYPLTVTVVPDMSVLIRISYDGSRFSSETIARLLGHLHTVLEGMLVSPQQRLADIALLTPAERQHLLFESNATATPYPKHASIPALFQEQVERTPDTIALACDDQQLSYRELDLRATQLAHVLREQGVDSEKLVALYLERSLDLIIATLATLQAGGAYLPLSLDDPAERLAFILAETQPTVLLTWQPLREMLPTHTIPTLCLERDWPGIIRQPTDALPLNSQADSLAYVMYTSGSSGRPKGVSARQQGVVRLVRESNYAPLDASQVCVQFAPASFDAATLEIWGALLNGARLVIAPPGLLAMSGFATLLSEQHITLLWLSAGLFQQAVEFIPEVLAQVPCVLAGGDVLSPSHVQRLLQYGTGQTISNGYGPTENTTFTCTYAMQTVEQAQGPLPIGRPIANTTCYLLDATLQPVPVGVVGDLYTGGDGLARGYFHDPALTAERFVPHPFSSQPGERLYKTGDLARYRADGVIEFLGRHDQQVKLRGFRIELSEIEAALTLHPSVREAVVVTGEDQPGSKRLIAYLVLQPPAILTISEVRRYLQSHLPDYMVPSAFIVLEALPLTPNGKLDRRALPAPDSSRSSLEQTYTAPHTPVEHLLAGIWGQVLGLTQVGIHDNFFELGGDSILSIQIVARASAVGLSLTPRHLFQQPTIAQLALVVGDVAAAVQGAQELVVGAVSLTPIQHWFFDLELSQPQHWNQAVLLETRQPLRFAHLQEATRTLLAHHDTLRLRAQQQGADWSLTIATPEEQVPCTHIDLSTLAAEEQAEALEAVANALQASLDLTNGPIVRVAFFDLGSQRPGRLLFVIHHLAVDIVSWPILLEDFQSAYQQLRQGDTPVLPPKTTSYQHWSERLREYAQSQLTRSQLDFWLGQPWAGVQPLPLDTSGSLEMNTESSAHTLTIALSSEETQALLTEVPKAYHTHITEVLLTALVQAFARWTGHGTLLLHLEGHGREDVLDGVDLSRTVGWFTSLTPLVMALPNATEPGEALKSTKEQLRQMPQHGLSFGLLRYVCQDLTISTQLAALPHPEVSFNYSGRSASPLADAGLFAPASESIGAFHSPQSLRPHLLDINSGIADGQLYLEWTYSQNLYSQATIEKVANDYLQALRTLIRHCQSPQSGGYTPSDFPLARLNEQKLRELSILMKKADKS